MRMLLKFYTITIFSVSTVMFMLKGTMLRMHLIRNAEKLIRETLIYGRMKQHNEQNRRKIG